MSYDEFQQWYDSVRKQTVARSAMSWARLAWGYQNQKISQLQQEVARLRAVQNVTPYSYEAKLHHLWDGDTIWLIMQRGEGWNNKGRYRLFGVDTPEKQGKGVTEEEKSYALEAIKFVEGALEGQQLTVSTHKGRSKYDWLAEIWIGGVVSLSDLILKNGHGVPYTGGTKWPWAQRKAYQDAVRAQL